MNAFNDNNFISSHVESSDFLEITEVKQYLGNQINKYWQKLIDRLDILRVLFINNTLRVTQRAPSVEPAKPSKLSRDQPVQF